MQQPSHISPAQQYFQSAYQYECLNDVYHAVKLYKKAIRLAPAWAAPYRQLSQIYKERIEWKPSLYYGLKTVEYAPTLADWETVALAATALDRPEIKHQAWRALGYKPSKVQLIPIRLRGQLEEIVWASSLDLYRARIESIPHPASRRRYGEIVLHNPQARGHQVIGRRKIAIYDELDRLKKSLFDTFSVLLFGEQSLRTNVLEQLCIERGMGFDNWSKLTHSHRTSTEYYPTNFTDDQPEMDYQVIALASKNRHLIHEVLKTWRLISLGQYTQLEQHF